MKAMFSIALLAGLLIVELARPVWSANDLMPSLLDCGMIITCAAFGGPWSVFLAGWGGAGCDFLHGEPFGVGIMTACSAALIQVMLNSKQDEGFRERRLSTQVLTFGCLLFLLRLVWHFFAAGTLSPEWLLSFASRAGVTIALSVAVVSLFCLAFRSDSLRAPAVSRI